MSQSPKSFALAALLLLLTLSGFGGPPPKPDFNGKWTLNAAKSDFGPLPPPKSRVDEITQKDAHLTLVRSQVNPAGTAATLKLDCTIGGADCVTTYTEKDVQLTAKATWDGDVLVFDMDVTVPTGEIKMLDRFTRSADGKTIVVHRHLSTAMGGGDQTMVLEKQ
jgi:hypothetical protein